MELTQEQIKFLSRVCYGTWTLNSDGEIDVDGWVNMNNMNLTEIPVKFGYVAGYFDCSNNNLTTLKNCPTSIKVNMGLNLKGNNLTDYFKNIKRRELSKWRYNLYWGDLLEEYPFIINTVKIYLDERGFKGFVSRYPLTKLYLK